MSRLNSFLRIAAATVLYTIVAQCSIASGQAVPQPPRPGPAAPAQASAYVPPRLRVSDATATVPPMPKKLEYLIEPPDVLTLRCALNGYVSFTAELPVRADGTINLEMLGYAPVSIRGLNVEMARMAIEKHIEKHLVRFGSVDPKVNVYLDIASYNSKGYYVVSDHGGKNEYILRLPYTGNETVLDAIAQAGLAVTKPSKGRVWVGRPGTGVLPVKWESIVQAGDPTTNYAMQPNDRLYIENSIAKENDKSSLLICATGKEVQVSGPGFKATAEKVISNNDSGITMLRGNVRFQVDKDGLSIDSSAEQVELSWQDGKMKIRSSDSKN
jgi:protein involved in polysaccharide export with SLBB domain